MRFFFTSSERATAIGAAIGGETPQPMHGCGVDDPRQIDRSHCRVVGDDGMSVSLEKLYPYPAAAR
jgi:hypothetical protein